MTRSGPTTSGEASATGDVIHGLVLVLDEPLCFLVVNPERGVITDPDHPQRGMTICGRVLVMPGSRGGAVTPSQLCETIRAGVGPAAIILAAPDPALVAGCLIAERLYGATIPVIAADPATYRSLATGDAVAVGPGDRITRCDGVAPSGTEAT